MANSGCLSSPLHSPTPVEEKYEAFTHYTCVPNAYNFCRRFVCSRRRRHSRSITPQTASRRASRAILWGIRLAKF